MAFVKPNTDDRKCKCTSTSAIDTKMKYNENYLTHLNYHLAKCILFFYYTSQNMYTCQKFPSRLPAHRTRQVLVRQKYPGGDT